MTTPTPADTIRDAAPLTAETIKPGPCSEDDLRQMWNAGGAENWDDLESHERLAFAQTQAIEADRRRRADPTPPTMAPGDLAQWLEDHATHLQRMEEIGALPESELAPMLADAAALIRQHEANLTTAREADRRRAEIVTGEVQELAEWLSLTGERAGQWSDEDANRYDRAVALLRQQEADLTTAREALRRRAEPIAWCRSDDFADADTKRQSFSGWREQHSDCDMALYGVPVVASREATIEPTPSVSDLPSALVYDGREGVRIEAASHKRTSWVVRDSDWCLNSNGEWERDYFRAHDDPDFLTRTRWPSAAAAWEALQRSRVAEGVEAQPAAPSS